MDLAWRYDTGPALGGHAAGPLARPRSRSGASFP